MFILKKNYDQKYSILSYFSTFISVLFILIAMILYENYPIYTKTLSKLGTKYPALIFFSIALILACFSIAILFSEIINTIFIKKNIEEDVREKLLILLMISLICLIGIFIFPSTEGIVSFIHDSFAITFFVSIIVNIFVISIILSKNKLHYHKNIKYSIYIGDLTLISGIIYAIFNPFFKYSPIFQKTTVILLLVWLLLTHTIIKKEVEIKAK